VFVALRKSLEPDWETAERLYPIILELMEEYLKHVDEYGDENFVEYAKLENKIFDIAGKDISSEPSLWGW